MWTLPASLIGVYLLIVGGAYVGQRSLMYFPSGDVGQPAASALPEMAVISLVTSDDLTLRSWYAKAQPGKPTILYFHGNGGHIGMRASKVRPYLDAGFGVLLLEYRGYGDNLGKPSEKGLYADGRAAQAFLAAQGIKNSQIVAYGESLGSGVATQMAKEAADQGNPYASVVLEGGFSSAVDVAARHYPFLPVRVLMHDQFDSFSRVEQINTPLLMVHGNADAVVPIDFAKRLFRKAKAPKKFHEIDAGAHNRLETLALSRVVVQFIAENGPAK